MNYVLPKQTMITIITAIGQRSGNTLHAVIDNYRYGLSHWFFTLASRTECSLTCLLNLSLEEHFLRIDYWEWRGLHDYAFLCDLR